MKPLIRIVETARRSPPCRIVLPEGEDERVLAAACRASADGLAGITLLGRAGAIRAAARKHTLDLSGVAIEDPHGCERLAGYAASFHRLRAGKGATADEALRFAASPVGYAAMMVREGDADGTVGGAVTATADVVRAAILAIGLAPGVDLVSSLFLMMLCQPHHSKKGAFVFADCGLVVDPNAQELAEIAIASARSFRTLTGDEPRVAMLSFSTSGSAHHRMVAKVAEAARRVRRKQPALTIEGDIQFDAAFVESVGVTKAPNSVLKGCANVFVFPNLDAANIGYKIAQRIGGAEAIGPILQGLAKPANDLSRGCSAEDVYHMIAITVAQVGESRSAVNRLASL